MMKPFDIVTTPGGGVAIITEVNSKPTFTACIKYIEGMNPKREHNAWWSEGGSEGITVVDSVLRIIANAMGHPFSQNVTQGDRFFSTE